MIDCHCFLSSQDSREENLPTRSSSFVLTCASYAILMTVLHTLLNPQYTQRSNQHLNRRSKWKWVSSHLFMKGLMEQQPSKSSEYKEPRKSTSIDFFTRLILAIGLQLCENSGKKGLLCWLSQPHLHLSMWTHVYGYYFDYGWPCLQFRCGFQKRLLWVFTPSHSVLETLNSKVVNFEF